MQKHILNTDRRTFLISLRYRGTNGKFMFQEAHELKFITMLNIHLKIEAKKAVIIDGSGLLLKAFFPESLTRTKALDILYRVFEKDAFLLPYKVQKLSKRARRKLI